MVWKNEQELIMEEKEKVTVNERHDLKTETTHRQLLLYVTLRTSYNYYMVWKNEQELIMEEKE